MLAQTILHGFCTCTVLAVLAILPVQGLAQMPTEPQVGCKVRYVHDAAGNRTHREWFCWDGNPDTALDEVIGDGSGRAPFVGQLEANSLSPMPNPASDLLVLQLELPVENATVEIADMDGRVLSAQLLNGDRVTLNVAALACGSYLVRLVLGQEMLFTTFTVTR